MLAYRIRAVVLLCLAAITVTLSADQKDFLGRWTLMGSGDRGGAYWLEVKDEAGKLTAKFLNRGGHPIAMDNVRVEGDELIFTTPKSGTSQTFSEFRGKVSGGKISATLKSGERTSNLSGGRPPTWPAANANGQHALGTPVVLFDGKSLDAFGVQRAETPMNWSIEEGLMTNGEKANNLVSKEKFKDFKLNAEYKVGPGTNSGIYLRGRYELQVEYEKVDANDKFHSMGAIYSFIAPAVELPRKPGTWETYDITLVGRRLTVLRNGVKTIDNQEIPGSTGGALDSHEGEPGPFYIQGDHTGGMKYRNITIQVPKK